MRKLNNNGFTLIELLAVIVILSAISIVVVVDVTSSLDRNDKKEYDSQIKLAKSAAKIYFSLNPTQTCINVSQLMNSNGVDSYFPINSKTNLIKNGSVNKNNKYCQYTNCTGNCE